ncbi:MAG: hypothetical protein AB7I59_06050 [Geminicoccaceae bacterium]
MRRSLSRHFLAIASFLALGACQAPTARTPEETIPAGRSLVGGGITAGGSSVVAIGAGGADCGAPEVWSRAGRGWTERATGAALPGPCPALTARLSGDGRTLAVYDFSEARAALFDLGASGVTPAGTAAISSAIGSRFPPPGPNVALSGDGGRLLLGALNRGCRSAGGPRICGIAQLFEHEQGAWRSVATLRPPESDDGFAQFGQSVALTADGSLAVAGGTGLPGGIGTLWLYRLGSAAPEAFQKLTAPDEQPEFANSLALAADGSWLAVGGSQSVHLFRRQGEGFTFDRALAPPDPSAGYYGETVALSGDGRWLLVGAPRTDCDAGDRCGIAYLYDRSRGWELARTVRPATSTADANFGHRLAISPDGRAFAVQGALIHLFGAEGTS